MYARFTLLRFAADARPVAEALANAAEERYRALPGFVEVRFLILDEAAGEYGSLSIWSSRAAAEAAGAAMLSWVGAHDGAGLVAQPQSTIYEIYEPAAAA